MKTLYLLRHAKAESGNFTLQDEDRPLSQRGREACQDISSYIKKKKYTPDIVLCSTSARTRETLERVQDGFLSPPACKMEKKLYLATPGEMLAHIHALQDEYTSVLLIGHNPGMHHLAALLASAKHTALREELEIKYPTGALAVITFDVLHWKHIKPDTGTLLDFVVPKDLAQK